MRLTYKRSDVEFYSKKGAGLIETVGNYKLVRILDMCNIYALDTDKSVTPHLEEDGYWESWITSWFMNNLEKDSVFIDIGANTGYYGFIANALGNDVVLFEPNPVYATMLDATIAKNNWNVELQDVALSDYNGEAVLKIPTELHGSASLNKIESKYDTIKVNVPVRSLDEVMNADSQTNYMIKIDAEGEEERILDGAKKFLDEAGSVVILLEYTPEAYSSGFVDRLFSEWTVNTVNHDGNAQAITPNMLRSGTDWSMLVLR